MAIIKEIDGMVKVVHNLTETVSVSSTAVTGFLVVPAEGEITRIRVEVGTTLTCFKFTLAQEDVFSSAIDGSKVIADYRVDEANLTLDSSSTKYVLTESPEDLYYFGVDAVTGKSENFKKLYYRIVTDNAATSTAVIDIDIEAVA